MSIISVIQKILMDDEMDDNIKRDKVLDRLIYLTQLSPFQNDAQKYITLITGLDDEVIPQFFKDEMDNLINLEEEIADYREEKSIEMEPEKYLIINYEQRKVFKRIIRMQKDGTEYQTNYTLLKSVPDTLKIYDNPLANERTFYIEWLSHLNKNIILTGNPDYGSSLKDISLSLTNQGYVHTNSNLETMLASLIECLIMSGECEFIDGVRTPGFYLKPGTDTIIPVKYEYYDPNINELKSALLVLNLLSNYYDKVKFSTVIKWNLIAPFNYIRKDKVKYLPWLYLWDKSRVGKTTLGKIGLYLYNYPQEGENNIGGSSFNTEARIGINLELSTFPLMVSETLKVFEDNGVKEMLKTAIESKVSRGTHKDGNYNVKQSLRACLITANDALPEDVALRNRFISMQFTHAEAKTDKEINEFNELFEPDAHKTSQLVLLNFIGQYFVEQVRDSKSLLYDDWKVVTRDVLQQAYLDCGLEVPEWTNLIYSQKEMFTNEDVEAEEIEMFRNWLISKINSEVRHILIYKDGFLESEEKSFDEETVKSSEEFRDRVWNVFNENKLPWAMLKESYGKPVLVCFTTGMKRALKKDRVLERVSLASLSEMMRWEYKNIRLGHINRCTRVIATEFNTLLSFLYPNINFKEEEEGQ